MLCYTKEAVCLPYTVFKILDVLLSVGLSFLNKNIIPSNRHTGVYLLTFFCYVLHFHDLMEVGLQEKKQQLSSHRCMEYVPLFPFKFAQFHHHLKRVNLKRKMSKCE